MFKCKYWRFSQINCKYYEHIFFCHHQIVNPPLVLRQLIVLDNPLAFSPLTSQTVAKLGMSFTNHQNVKIILNSLNHKFILTHEMISHNMHFPRYLLSRKRGRFSCIFCITIGYKEIAPQKPIVYKRQKL